ncbi:MAG: hypothetical protein AAGD25_07375 [Cyanobacteria bacterium P01_F01_bin.150]
MQLKVTQRLRSVYFGGGDRVFPAASQSPPFISLVITEGNAIAHVKLQEGRSR